MTMASTQSQLPETGKHTLVTPTAYPAGFFSRMEAFVIDIVILSVVQLVGAAFVRAILNFFNLTGLVDSLKTILENSTYNIAISSTVLTLMVIGYYTFFWTLVGFTPGKAILGLKVARKNGSKVSFGRALVRFFAYWVSAIPLFLGFIWVLWDPKRQGWHDKIAGTQVFYTPKNLRK
jgi:uncharacterized RDD family membrane protein YckC